MTKPSIIIYTDGGASPNPGPGGWAALLIYNQHRKEISGGEEHTTNNRMELTAAIQALNALKEPCQIDLFTDSTYLKNGITEWLGKWLENGWRTSKRKPVLNQDLWKRLYECTQKHAIEWHWVKGHGESQENNQVDKLVALARKQFTQSKLTVERKQDV